jgi:hypothetical protein
VLITVEKYAHLEFIPWVDLGTVDYFGDIAEETCYLSIIFSHDKNVKKIVGRIVEGSGVFLQDLKEIKIFSDFVELADLFVYLLSIA